MRRECVDRMAGCAAPWRKALALVQYSVLASIICTGSSNAEMPPIHASGNLGYVYSLSEATGGNQAEFSNFTAALNANTYIWQPWFAKVDGGGSYSWAGTNTKTLETDNKVTSSRLNLRLLPISRFPFTLSYTSSDNSYDRQSKDDTFIDDIGRRLETQDLRVKQSIIGRNGWRLDGWYDWRLRGSDDFGDLEDKTFGAKVDGRTRKANFLLNATRQTQEHSLIDKTSKNTLGSFMVNYFPTGDFYIKTLGSQLRVQNDTPIGNGSFRAGSTTDTGQVTSFFYWRPVFKPYTMTGGARVHRRVAEFASTDTETRSFAANLAANYQINRKMRLTATGSVSSLDTAENNSLGSKQGVAALFQSDRHLFRKFNYYWHADAGISNEVLAQFETTELTQTVNATLGHNGSRKWITGNRSNLRLNLQQALQRSIQIGGSNDRPLSLVNSASLAWSDNPRKGAFYAQISGTDQRNINDEGELQVVNMQVSRSAPLSRVSGFGAHLSVQSTRQDAGDNTRISHTTASTAQLSYQHARMFGIYKLKFKAKSDLSNISNREGADRKQLDGELRFSYGIGKLNSSFLLRMVRSDSGLGNQMGVFQINRGF